MPKGVPDLRPRPRPDDPDTGGFWRAAADGQLAIASCTDCQRVLHPPTGICPACGSTAVAWRPVAPTGGLFSWAVVEHEVDAAFPTPYTVVVVALDDEPDVRLIGHLDGRPALVPGQPMEAVFDDVRAGVTVPRWTAVGAPGAAP